MWDLNVKKNVKILTLKTPATFEYAIRHVTLQVETNLATPSLASTMYIQCMCRQIKSKNNSLLTIKFGYPTVLMAVTDFIY